MNQALLSSKDMDWCTPDDFFAELDREFLFALDAAATKENAKCAQYYSPETDGLSQPWTGRGGAVFCNPPYGRAIGKWVRKAYDESRKGATVVMLIPARTDTAYFHDYILGKAEIRFIRGRLHFKRPGCSGESAPFPSMLAIFRPEADAPERERADFMARRKEKQK